MEARVLMAAPSRSAFLCAICVTFWTMATAIPEEIELLQVHILYRHGDRSPITTFPLDTVPESKWPQGFGQLSAEGMQQQLELGRYFRDRYILGHPYRLLNETYRRGELRVESTDVDRTLLSAYSNLAGLYPPSGDPLWNRNVSWQTIPVHTRPEASEHVLSMDLKCPKYADKLLNIQNSELIRQDLLQDREFYEHVANATGLTGRGLFAIGHVYDSLFCQKKHGIDPPAWAGKVFDGRSTFDKLGDKHRLYFQLVFANPDHTRLLGGPLLGKLVKDMTDKALNASKGIKCFIYSAHDSTLTGLTAAMGVYNGIVPPYATALMVELLRRRSAGNGSNEGRATFVRLLYSNASDLEPFRLVVPGCAEDCPLEQFVELTRDNIPSDWEAECQTGFSEKQVALIGAGSVVGLAVLLVVLVLVCRARHRRQRLDLYLRLNTETDD